MSLISMEFLTFVAVAVIGYYLIPKRYQWVWLLAFSYIYYASSGMKYLVFLVYTTVVTYGTARLIYGADQKFADQKEKIKTYKKSIMVLALVLDFGMLAVLKYTTFIMSNINTLFHADIRMVKFLLPLGISFYTFQSVGYILDVYWKRYEPEKNIFKFALFVSFFPQILQGPIGRYSNLAHQFYEEHSFDFMRIERGVQRVLWGFFKKMVIADTAAVFVDAIFDQYQTYNGLAILGVLAYSAQLYGDFSGGMDVVIGIASMFGIEMDENFKRPYFAVSITDFWHRWHITLGTWMKDYLFYPLSLSKGMGKFGKFAKKTFGKTYGRALPICVANIVVFLVVGIWHGAAWKFIVYGLYNGIIIGFSGLMAKNYRDWKKKFKINDKSNGWHIFQIVRTFILVNISWFFDRADTIPQAFTMMKNAVTVWKPVQILDIRIGTSGPAYTIMAIGILCIGCLVQFIVSYKQECGMQIRESIAMQPRLVRWAVYMALVLSISAISLPANTAGGFIYAQF